jgi:hypothetical protein
MCNWQITKRPKNTHFDQYLPEIGQIWPLSGPKVVQNDQIGPKMSKLSRFWPKPLHIPDIWGPFVKVWYIGESMEWLAGYRPPVPVEDGPVQMVLLHKDSTHTNPYDMMTEYLVFQRVAMSVMWPDAKNVLRNLDLS